MTENPDVLPTADQADEYEQSRDATPVGDDRRSLEPLPLEADEADVLEQSRSLPMTDEDESPDES